MTSTTLHEGSKTVPVKPKVDNATKVPSDATKDESRSFLTFSRENLSISHSDIEQGFNKPSRLLRPRVDRILSLTAIFLALFCIGLEIWKIQCVIGNTRDIDLIKSKIDGMKHRFLEEDLLEELKAFEQQLYAEEDSDDDDDEDGDIDDEDYDAAYDDEDDDESSFSAHEYSGDYRGSPFASQTFGPAEVTSFGPRESREKILETLDKAKEKQGAELLKSVLEGRKDIQRRLHEEETEIGDEVYSKLDGSTIKRKRSLDIDEQPIGHNPSGVPIYARSYLARNRKNTTENSLGSRLRLYETLSNSQQSATTEHSREPSSVHHPVITSWDKRPPKKYYAQTRRAPSRIDIPQSYVSRDHYSEEIERLRSRWREEGPQALTRRESTVNLRDGKSFKVVQDIEGRQTSSRRRGMMRRHLRVPKQVFAAHYGADSTLFTADDEHTGNGRARHNAGVFKAWSPSSWMNELGMNRHFNLGSDGRLVVEETGLYLIYAQIHYLDEHDENGFHVMVNGKPILQCMVYSPGDGHKSRSCFSAQATLLHSGDTLLLKDIGQSRYTLFQHDKSFFGLVKLGESRPMRQQPQL